ncbi:MAG: SDR family NAD(P)-dependent oxidoreductase [Polyangiaceae bacterium]|nr:SDR family NAD(P)-dependent oxidoreductase [Polyangiaceae bacterium]
MQRALAGKVAWVQGASRGVGRAVAVRLGAEGARVLVSARGERALGETVGEIAFQGGRACHLVADARDPSACEAAARHALATLGGLDLVVTCAGVSSSAPLLDPTVDALGAGVAGALHAFRAAAPLLPRGGRLIAVASSRARADAATSGVGALVVGATSALVRALALELAPRGVTVHGVAGRCDDAADPDDLARAVALLAGPAGDLFAAQVLSVGP